MDQILQLVLNNGGSKGSEGQNGSNSPIGAEQRGGEKKRNGSNSPIGV